MESFGSEAIFGSTSTIGAVKEEKSPAAKETKKRGAVVKTAVKAAKKATEKKTTKAGATAEAANATTVTTKDETKADAVLADTKESTAKAKTKAGTRKAAKTSEKKAAKTANDDKPKRKYTKKSDVKNSVFIQFKDQQVNYDAVLGRVEEDCKSQNVEAKNLSLYIKPEDNACYYVANDGFAGRVDLY